MDTEVLLRWKQLFRDGRARELKLLRESKKLFSKDAPAIAFAEGRLQGGRSTLDFIDHLLELEELRNGNI